MDTVAKASKAINYIESNLKNPLSIAEVASHVGMSFWHFQRMFSVTTGQSLGAYIRKRRVQESLLELSRDSWRVVDVAFEYQFESHEVYTRVFKSLFGVPPSRYREIRNRVSYPMLSLSPTTLNLKIGGNLKMTPKIETLESMKFVGMKIGSDELMNEELPIANLWDRFWKDFKRIQNVLPDAYGLYAPTLEADTVTEACYVAAVPVSDFAETPECYSNVEVESGLYALFDFKGSTEALTEAQNYIYSEWLPCSDYESREGFDMEIYNKDFQKEGVIRLAIPIDPTN